MKPFRNILLPIILIIWLCSCNTKTETNSKKYVSTRLLVDSTYFGKPKKLLVEGNKLVEKDGSTIKFLFKQKFEDNWIVVDSFSREITDVLEPCIEFNDYDFDGFIDLSFNSDLGMNGSNEMRTIILFNPKLNRIKVLDISTEYPNLRINKEKKMLVSTIFSGSTENVFCRIEDDTINRIAILDFDKKLSLIKYSKGQITSIKEINNISCNRYTRFSDFEPIRKE